MKTSLPFVVVATTCEKALQEKDDVISLIRIVDTYFIPDEASVQTPNAALPVTAVVALKCGDSSGEGELSLSLKTPDGNTADFPEKFPVLFSSPAQGANVICNLGLSLKYMGTSWVSVYWNAELLTKFPITLAPAKK